MSCHPDRPILGIDLGHMCSASLGAPHTRDLHAATVARLLRRGKPADRQTDRQKLRQPVKDFLLPDEKNTSR